MSYTARILDQELDALLPALPAIAIEGAKGVGKTSTALERASSQFRLDELPARQRVEADPYAVVRSVPPVLIDEWQRVPQVWDVVRRAVDDGAPPGSFLLTGSAMPRAHVVTHSGAGRVVSLRMRPLTLPERGVAEPTVSLADLLDGPGTEICGSTDVALPDYVEEIERSGFPGIRSLPPRARRAQLDGYLQRMVTRDLDEQGIVVRRPATLTSWLEAYAAATSSTASYNEIRRAATPGDPDPPTKATSIRHREWLTGLWLVDPVQAWTGTGHPLAALGQAPKHHLADPALAARLLRVGGSSMLDGSGRLLTPRAGTVVGALFESLVTLGVRVFAQAAEATTSHLRTRRGDHEVDLVVERFDGRLVGIEVKLTASVRDHDVRHLDWLARQVGDRLVERVVVTTGPEAYRRRDGVAVVPLALLGP